MKKTCKMLGLWHFFFRCSACLIGNTYIFYIFCIFANAQAQPKAVSPLRHQTGISQNAKNAEISMYETENVENMQIVVTMVPFYLFLRLGLEITTFSTFLLILRSSSTQWALSAIKQESAQTQKIKTKMNIPNQKCKRNANCCDRGTS